MNPASPLTWTTLDDGSRLKNAFARHEDWQSCVKMKCRSKRSLRVAILHNALGQEKEAKKHLQLCLDHLASWVPKVEEDMLRKKVLSLLASKAAVDLGMIPAQELEPLATAAEEAMFLYLRGKFYFYTYHPIQAKDDLRRSFQLSPESNFAIISLAVTLRSMRRATDRFRRPDASEMEILKIKLERTDNPRAASRLAAALLDELQDDQVHGGVRLGPVELIALMRDESEQD